MSRIYAITATAISTLSILFGCSGKSNHELALQLLQQADTAVATANYNYALEILDTLKAKYPEEIDIQRTAINIRPRAIEGISIRQIEQTDSLQALYSHHTDSLMAYFTTHHNKELGHDYDYYIIKQLDNSDIFGKTGIQGRVSPSGEFSIISSLTAKPVRHTQISISAPNGQTVESAKIAYDGERNYRSSGTETITFIAAECDTIGSYLSSAPDSQLKLNFIGDKTYTMPLSKIERRSVELAWQLAYCINQKNKLAQQRQLYERQLALARDQIARTMLD